MVFRKRPADAGTGRYVEVKKKMQERITERLRYFWDQGISGPDFVWAAIGPALESYSRYREVRRLDGRALLAGRRRWARASRAPRGAASTGTRGGAPGGSWPGARLRRPPTATARTARRTRP